MRDVGYVTGCAEQAQELVVNVDTVYVHTDITPIEPKEGEEVSLYRYHEVQYGKDEYIQMMAEQNKEYSKLINTMLGVNE